MQALALFLIPFSFFLSQGVDSSARAPMTPGKLHVDTSAVGWYSSRQYPEWLRKVYRYKPLIGGDTAYWHGALPQDEVMVGYLVLDSGAAYPAHLHPSPEIYYVIEGRASWTVGSETFVAGPGMAIYTPPDTVHRIVNIGGTPLRTVYYWWAPGGDRRILNAGSHLLEGIPHADSTCAADSVRLRRYAPSDSVVNRHHVSEAEVEWTTNWSYPALLQRVYRYRPLIGSGRERWPGITQEDVGFGLQELDPGAIYPRHAHPCQEVYYILEGAAEFSVGDQIFAARPATAIFIPSNVVHRIANGGGEKLRWLYFWWAPGGRKQVLETGSRLVAPSPAR